ncbi:HEAT repeat [Litoreibacter ascidiaceicola]|uniref:HEAT repeat n=1 Tax=Litoreibacter ascidiaceicola TaxID=1486859 RepID=A0A1M5B1B6_9RHOB|nr:HEAT repeat domain-containing protein [Litoreibacter ascidiaceicola]SHF36249.1 HEAT repeat [Litoreibacter ascidiaceicola]
MLGNSAIPATDHLDPIRLILEHLSNGNEVIRTGAVRAVAAIGLHDNRVHDALLASLLDEDPDVRTDAMDALVLCGKPEEVDTLRLSLCGDPVREVKHAAIQALAKLNDAASIPIFRQLVASRASDDVAWEDDSDAWDDWLDVQVAVIKALGEMNAKGSIQDILAARDDEEGQVLDGPVFAALAAMGSDGAVWLLSIAQTETGLGRKRALEALANMRSELLHDYLDVIVKDSAADVRRLALPLLKNDDDRVEALTLHDPDENLRCEALSHFAAARPDIVVKSLSDPSELVQAAALDQVQLPLDVELHASLIANVLAWVSISKSSLATAAARILPRLAPEMALEPLLDLVRDTTRPLEARLAAVSSLAHLNDASSTERLVALLSNETQQVRTVALTRLVERCNDGDSSAGHALAMSIDGTLLSPDKAIVTHVDEDGSDLAMSKIDTPPRGHVKISRDGKIVEVEKGEGVDSAQSTLSALQSEESQFVEAELAEDTPEESGAKRKHRRPVEGPDAIADDLRVVALGIAGRANDRAIETAVFDACESEDDALRLAAWRALEQRAEAGLLNAQPEVDIEVGLTDENPAIRSATANILAMTPETTHALRGALLDPDALVRAIALRHCSSDGEAITALSDSTLVVRVAALERILASKDTGLAALVFDTLVKAERIDTLADACSKSDEILTLSIQALAETEISPKRAHVLLEAVARSRPVYG